MTTIADSGPALRLTGYSSRTGVGYQVGDFTESIERGAFRRTLAANADVQLLVNHSGVPLARTKSSTMQLSEDEHGLLVEATLDPESPDVQSVARALARGDLDEMSFAFRVGDTPDAQSLNDDYTQRTIRDCDIHLGDLSIVNHGANPATSVGISSGASLADRRRYAEQIGRNVVVQTRGAFMVGLNAPTLEQRAALVQSARFGVYMPARPDGLSLARRQRRDGESLLLLQTRQNIGDGGGGDDAGTDAPPTCNFWSGVGQEGEARTSRHRPRLQGQGGGLWQREVRRPPPQHFVGRIVPGLPGG
jgi:HK97 family phage prohead protease